MGHDPSPSIRHRLHTICAQLEATAEAGPCAFTRDALCAELLRFRTLLEDLAADLEPLEPEADYDRLDRRITELRSGLVVPLINRANDHGEWLTAHGKTLADLDRRLAALRVRLEGVDRRLAGLEERGA